MDEDLAAHSAKDISFWSSGIAARFFVIFILNIIIW